MDFDTCTDTLCFLALCLMFTCSTFRDNVNEVSATVGLLFALAYFEGDILIDRSTGIAIQVGCYYCFIYNFSTKHPFSSCYSSNLTNLVHAIVLIPL